MNQAPTIAKSRNDAVRIGQSARWKPVHINTAASIAQPMTVERIDSRIGSAIVISVSAMPPMNTRGIG
jgi:hypothetical protein